MSPSKAKKILEAVLFMAPEPLSTGKLSELTSLTENEVSSFLKDIEQDLIDHDRGVRLETIAGGVRFVACKEAEPYLLELSQGQKRNPLSPAALEVLAIISYMQPITRTEIDEIRGVSSESSIGTLLDRGLIAEVGRKEAPGRPILFATTKAFLVYFGLKDLTELPELSEFKEPDDLENTNPPSLVE
ncbi:MAG: SMC-Scp complex subunit ScpB [Firmicutes bacterium]|nr:SMC-Scp complex subunit ScpB [Bacillota bacterium]